MPLSHDLQKFRTLICAADLDKLACKHEELESEFSLYLSDDFQSEEFTHVATAAIRLHHFGRR